MRLDEFGIPIGETAASLLNRHIEPPRWIFNGLIPEGLTVLAGKPKVGKSWLMVALCLAAASGRAGLNHFTSDPVDVLLIALEDGDFRMQKRLNLLQAGELTEDELARLHIHYDWPRYDSGGLEAIEQTLMRNPDIRLVFIDTFQKFRGVGGPGRNQYETDYEISGAIQMLATKYRVAIVLLHHVRQMPAEDWMDTVAGSSGITGAADTVAALFRERGAHDATFRGTGRDIADFEHALANKGTGDFIRWEYMGDAEMYRTTRERIELLEAMRELDATADNPAKVSVIAEAVGKSTANTSKLLRALHGEKKVVNTGHGLYALSPYISVDSVDSVDFNPSKSTTSTTSSKSTTSTTSTDLHGPSLEETGSES